MRRWMVLILLIAAVFGLAAMALASWPWEEEAPLDPMGGIWNWLGLGYNERALAEAQRIVRLRPADTEAHLILALLLQERGDGNRAEKEFRLAFPRSEDRPYLLTSLGQVALARAEWKTAAGYFREALAKTPDLAQASYGLAQAMAGAGDKRAAIGVLQRLTKDCPAWPAAFLLLGDLMAANGAKLADIAAVYERAGASNPSDVELRLRWARLLQQLGQKDKAREVYANVLMLEPENEEARKALGGD